MYDENCFTAIREFIKRQLDLDADKMYIARAHRLGPRKIGFMAPRRPIIANFRDFCDTDIIMSRAHLLRNTPFSIGYDLPKEIKEARKKLWDEVKRIKQTSPRVKFQIVYPAKLLVEGKVVMDEFPDWGRVMKGSRLADFGHIDRYSTFDLRTNSEARTRDQPITTQVNRGMNEHSGNVRDNLNMPTPGPHDLSSGSMEHDDSDTQVQVHGQSNSQLHEPLHTVLPSSPAGSSLSKTADTASASQHIFRPYEHESSQRPSRPTQRGFRRAGSVSVPRESRASSTNTNKQSGSKNRNDMTQKRNESVPTLQTVNPPGESRENEQGASGENINDDDFDTIL